MDPKNAKGIAEILLAKGLITPDQLSFVKLESSNIGKPVERVVLDHKFASEEAVAEARAQFLGLPFVVLTGMSISADILGNIPEQVARKYTLIPFDRKDGFLSVAMVDPLDQQVVEFIEQKSGQKIKPYVAVYTDIIRAIGDQYSASLSTDVSAALKEAGGVMTVPGATRGAKDAGREVTGLGKGEVLRDAPVAKIVAQLLEYGIKSQASDIHIEPLEEKTRVRFRLDGILHEKLILPQKVHDAVVSRIKVLSGMKIEEKRIPQDGRFDFVASNQEVDLRVSSLPTAYGEKIVMRILKKSGGVPTLNELGLRGSALKVFETQILRPHGIVLITGPTGSGKTTTLYSVLSKINSVRVNIMTLEDPIEYRIPGVNQVQINPGAGLTFASGMRSFLRQDPNIILVGEMRDTETEELGIQAALTGHLVFSTLHTNNASGALPRLLDMGAEPYLITSTINCIVGQRIARKICPSCKEAYVPPPPVLEDVKKILGSLYTTQGDLKLYRGKGCKDCSSSGYSGRIGVFEVMQVSEKIGRLVLERRSSQEIEKVAVTEGMITMKQDGYLKVVEGVTTLEEVLRVAQD